MTRICLIRHGQTDWNKEHLIQGRVDTLLNAEGRLQAANAGKKIKKLNIKWDYIYSSPLKRAYETAVIAINEAKIDKEIIVLDDLVEREFGELEGKKVGLDNYKLMASGEAKGLEKQADLEIRATNAVLKIASFHPNSNVLVFTHSQVIKGVLAHQIKDFDFTCALDNSSLNFIEVDNDIITIKEINK